MKVLYNDGTIAECAPEDELHVIRHTAAHILAQAVKRLYPEAHFGYGPANENGFYYDIDLGDAKVSDEDLPAIEDEMKKVVKENLKITTFELPRAEAIKLIQLFTKTWPKDDACQGFKEKMPELKEKAKEKAKADKEKAKAK